MIRRRLRILRVPVVVVGRLVRDLRFVVFFGVEKVWYVVVVVVDDDFSFESFFVVFVLHLLGVDGMSVVIGELS